MERPLAMRGRATAPPLSATPPSPSTPATTSTALPPDQALVAVLASRVIIWDGCPDLNAPPHCHAVYGDYAGAFVLTDCSLLAGQMPPSQAKKIKTFILDNQNVHLGTIASA